VTFRTDMMTHMNSKHSTLAVMMMIIIIGSAFGLPGGDIPDKHWWSPKGDQIVFDRGRGGKRELFITDLEGHERQLTYRKDFKNCERTVL